MTRRGVILGSFPLLAVACLLVCKAAGGQPDEPERKFTSMVLTGSLEQVGLAITNAFGNGAYHRKYLFAPPYDYVIEGQKRISIPLTNAWDLAVPDQGWLPLTLIPAGKSMVAYDENFFIKAEAVGGDTTRLSIRSEGSGTTERRYELSPHLVRVLGGTYHQPLPSETTNLFVRIAKQLMELRAGRTNALPPTPDTAPGYYLQFWTSMNVEQQHDRRNWEKMVQAWNDLQQGHNEEGHLDPLPATRDANEVIKLPMKEYLKLHLEAKDELVRAIQTETNAGLRQELIKMLIAGTNGPAK